MSTRKIFSSSVLPILMLLLVAAGPAAAKRSDAAPVEQTGFLLRTPEARAQAWQDGLLKFMAEHRDLTSEQAYAVENLAEIENPTAFAYTLQPQQRDLIAKRLDELGRVLPYRDYLRVLRSFDDELRVWLVRNGFASEAAASVIYCNCTTGAGGCATGFSCTSLTCIHEAGTTHNGRCADTSIIEK